MTNDINCEEDFFDAGRGKVYYVKYSSENTTGIPLIMIHGGPGFTHHYLAPMYGLANERPVIFYDQLGCGKSDRPEDLSFCNVDYFVNELCELINHLKLKEVSLLGHSWGSSVAAEYALANENVSHLILASPYMSSPLWNADIARYKKALPKELQIAIEKDDYADELFLKAHETYYDRHVYRSARKDRSIRLATESASSLIYNTMWGKDEFSITGTLKDYDCSNRLDKITAKTLFIAGEFDTGSPKACREMAKKIPNSIVKSVKGCAHFPHLEKKQEYNGYLRNFLSDKLSVQPEGILTKLIGLFPLSSKEVLP